LKVALRKVSHTPLEFDIESDKINFKGYLQYDSAKLILLKANLSGMVDVLCNRCGGEFALSVDEEIEFFISDGIYEDIGGIELDVVETFSAHADLDELLNSEIELVKSDYHYCKDCQE
jgi:uncharacterized metal-binding protein YceD (DUF177 family)